MHVLSIAVAFRKGMPIDNGFNRDFLLKQIMIHEHHFRVSVHVSDLLLHLWYV